ASAESIPVRLLLTGSGIPQGAPAPAAAGSARHVRVQSAARVERGALPPCRGGAARILQSCSRRLFCTASSGGTVEDHPHSVLLLPRQCSRARGVRKIPDWYADLTLGAAATWLAA